MPIEEMLTVWAEFDDTDIGTSINPYRSSVSMGWVEIPIQKSDWLSILVS